MLWVCRCDRSSLGCVRGARCFGLKSGGQTAALHKNLELFFFLGWGETGDVVAGGVALGFDADQGFSF